MRVLQQLLDEQRHAHGREAADGRVVTTQLGDGAPEARKHRIPPAAHAQGCLSYRPACRHVSGPPRTAEHLMTTATCVPESVEAMHAPLSTVISAPC